MPAHSFFSHFIFSPLFAHLFVPHIHHPLCIFQAINVPFIQSMLTYLPSCPIADLFNVSLIYSYQISELFTVHSSYKLHVILSVSSIQCIVFDSSFLPKGHNRYALLLRASLRFATLRASSTRASIFGVDITGFSAISGFAIGLVISAAAVSYSISAMSSIRPAKGQQADMIYMHFHPCIFQ